MDDMMEEAVHCRSLVWRQEVILQTKQQTVAWDGPPHSPQLPATIKSPHEILLSVSQTVKAHQRKNLSISCHIMSKSVFQHVMHTHLKSIEKSEISPQMEELFDTYVAGYISSDNMDAHR
jgi:hypothetical protein